MPGPAPKSLATRRRSNRASTRRELSPAPTVETPDLPAERDWHSLTLAWWGDVWASPMAGEYLYADRHGLFRLALPVDDYWLASSPRARAESTARVGAGT